MIAIVIPAYNEERTVGRVISEVKRVMGNTGYKYKIIVVDDGSRDKTAAIAKDLGAIVISHPMNYGLAEAFRTGMQKALLLNAEIIVHIDADGQYSAAEIPMLIGYVGEGYDLVLGNRLKGKIEHMPFINRIGNRMFSRVVSKIARIKISDAQTGFRAFTKDVAKIKITSNHTYTQEQIIRAIKQKYRLKEVPIHFAKRHGKSKLIKNPLDYAIKAFINILRVYRDYEPLKFFGGAGLGFMLTGFFIGLWLVYLFLTLDVVGRTPSIILSVLFLVIGIQLIIFGFLADMYKKDA